MKIAPLTPSQRQQRQQIAAKVAALQQAGTCPTCAAAAGQDVYPPAAGRIFHEDDLCLCMLEQYPRNPGHSILLIKPHYEDLLHLPPDAATALWPVLHCAGHALKAHLAAEKVYLCTMCDGVRNHLHFQLIPRLPGDAIKGSRLFVKERGLLSDWAGDVTALKSLMGKA